MALIKMALRNLSRNKRRSFFSALALGIGVALLLLMSAFMKGEMRSSMDSSIKLDSGHLQVRAASYEVDKLSLAYEDLIESPQEVAAQITTLTPVKVATPRLYASGIVTVSDQSFGVRVVGVDPRSAANQPYLDGLVSGAFLSAGDRDGIMIGKTLADKIHAAAGDTIQLLVNTSDGEVDEQAFTIRGIYSTKVPTYDRTTVFLDLGKAQSITRSDNRASTIFVLLNDRDQAGLVQDALKTSRYKVMTFEQMNELYTMMDQYVGAVMIVLYLIVLGITATVIINTLIMAVFERTREIGILAAIGMKSGRIRSLFFAESFFLAVGGVAIGLVLGGIAVAYTTRYGIFFGDMGISGFMIGERVYTYLTLNDAISLTITAFVVTLLAAVYPASLAANLQPVDAMRGGKHE